MLRLSDALPGHAEFGQLGAIKSRQLATVDQLLLAPGIDRLITNTQISSNLGDRTDSVQTGALWCAVSGDS